MAQLNEEFL